MSAAVGIQLAETSDRTKMADEQVAAVAVVPGTYQTGWVVVVQLLVEVRQSQWVVPREEVAGNFGHLPSERKGSMPIGGSPC